MKKVIVFIFTLVLSYGLVSWGAGLVLTVLHDTDPWMVNTVEEPSIFVRILPAVTLILPLLIAVFITNKFSEARGVKE
ncbi:hypothetical protein J0K78_14875 [Halobacillus sp. GSS1]|uniref:hypothetical protein n=1 Tax=Halobacillus sp. GSS1 TaxID=2815919 RepID=UPI001A900968|nr:hypothetical protein [Halobacillus sp. GSS1]MBN9655565.1 hypothetical protein [Halobacillus sp. GSS1]